jgi:hypothetical protein
LHGLGVFDDEVGHGFGWVCVWGHGGVGLWS